MIALLAFFLFRPSARERYSRAYPAIKVGDTKQSIISVFGKPSAITNCYSYQHSEPNETLAAKCAEEYWFRAGLEEWVLVLDKDGVVISKGHDISY